MMELDQIVRDLRVFADPATPYVHALAVDSTKITMIREGEERTYVVQRNGRVIALHDKREYASIPSLLASSDFADTRALRSTQRRLLDGGIHAFAIPPEGTIETAEDGNQLTEDGFRDRARYKASGSLVVLLVDGPAGIGKTSLIERLVYSRSDPSSGEPPLLHVTSSGKRLTSLIQELAHATQLLRARITFDQVPVLARWGVIQVAIDGFDELVDDSGYRDAWSALREFLGQVETGGPIILAGRDTFFDQQDFRGRLGARIPNLDLTTARLQPVSKTSAHEFLRQAGWSDEDLRSADSRDWFQAGSYQLRPFFLAQIASAGAWSDLRDAHGSPQSFIVERFVRREAELVSKMVPIAANDAEQALWDFYGVVVEDMAIQESDSVDVGYLGLACETAFSGRLPQSELDKLVHKAGSFGLLEAGGGELRRFPHSEIQAQFLARALIRSLLNTTSSLSYLRRVGVAMPVAEAFADSLLSCTSDDVGRLIGRMLSVKADEPLANRLISNVLCLLLASLTRVPAGITVEVNGGDISTARVFGVLEPASFKNVAIGTFDVRGADLREVQFCDCTVATLTADDSTQFGVNRPQISAITLVTNTGAVKALRAPEEVANWISAHSPAEYPDGPDPQELPLVRYFDRLCRRFVRQHQIRNGASDAAYFLINEPFWAEVRPLLGTRLVVVESGRGAKEAAGPNDGFLRLRSPENLLNPPSGDTEAIAIRGAVIARARQIA